LAEKETNSIADFTDEKHLFRIRCGSLPDVLLADKLLQHASQGQVMTERYLPEALPAKNQLRGSGHTSPPRVPRTPLYLIGRDVFGDERLNPADGPQRVGVHDRGSTTEVNSRGAALPKPWGML